MTLMTDRDLAHELGLSAGTLRNWRMRGAGPPFVRIGGLVRYRPADVEAWLAGRVARGTRRRA